MPTAFYKSSNRDFTLLKGDCKELLRQFDFKFDMIFADPPYFLSNGGISVQSGKIVCVNKGDWDKGLTQQYMHAFNHEWLSLCREKLKDNGTIWISGTYHNIFSVATNLIELGYKILNVVNGQKPIRHQTYHAVISHIPQNLLYGRGKQRRNHTFSIMN